MTLRRYATTTQRDHLRRLTDFATFLDRSPEFATFEDVRNYQLHLTATGATVSYLNHVVSTLRFVFRITLGRWEIDKHTHFIRQQRRLPVVLSPDEVTRS